MKLYAKSFRRHKRDLIIIKYFIKRIYILCELLDCCVLEMQKYMNDSFEILIVFWQCETSLEILNSIVVLLFRGRFTEVVNKSQFLMEFCEIIFVRTKKNSLKVEVIQLK